MTRKQDAAEKKSEKIKQKDAKEGEHLRTLSGRNNGVVRGDTKAWKMCQEKKNGWEKRSNQF